MYIPTGGKELHFNFKRLHSLQHSSLLVVLAQAPSVWSRNGLVDDFVTGIALAFCFLAGISFYPSAL